jgi:hypothetical protein
MSAPTLSDIRREPLALPLEETRRRANIRKILLS